LLSAESFQPVAVGRNDVSVEFLFSRIHYVQATLILQ
jgi:hypothetical protein